LTFGISPGMALRPPTRKLESALSLESITRKVMAQAAKLTRKAEELHDGVKRAEDIHHDFERSLAQAEHTLQQYKRKRRAG
jgi:hypothetical protein